MAEQPYDLRCDPKAVGGGLLAPCWVGHGPGADGEQFRLRPGYRVTVGDEDESSLSARVTVRDRDRVWVRIQLDADCAAA